MYKAPPHHLIQSTLPVTCWYTGHSLNSRVCVVKRAEHRDPGPVWSSTTISGPWQAHNMLFLNGWINISRLFFFSHTCMHIQTIYMKVKGNWKSLSHVRLFVTPWTIPHGSLQARILEWVSFPFSREFSQPRDRTQVSCITSRFFTSWTTREAQEYWSG